MQGLTFDAILITKLDFKRKVDPGTLNVALTRIHGMNGLFFSEPLSMQYISKFKPLKHLLDEDIKMKEKSEERLLAWQLCREKECI